MMYQSSTASANLTSRRRILLVEDHPAMREAVAELLDTDTQLAGLAGVGSAEEALELLEGPEARRPDLAVVDLNLPGMHGLQLVGELDRRAKIPVIVLSSHSSERYGPVALDAGARAYVEKIRTASELLETVHQVLDLPVSRGRGAHGLTAANANHRPAPPAEDGYRSGRPVDDGFDISLRPA